MSNKYHRRGSWVSYQNGNYTVKINLNDGTKIRENNLNTLEPSTIESFDMKITNWCDMYCPFCHEDSNMLGKHADLKFDGTFLSKLHPYTEIAIGGGNPLAHPDLEKFLKECKKHRFLPSITVNQHHFMMNICEIQNLANRNLIYGVGVSFVEPSKSFFDILQHFNNAVVHTIAGINSVDDYRAMKDKGLKVLILGYKQIRRGERLYESLSDEIQAKISDLKAIVRQMIDESWFEVLSFDNLALEQLGIKEILPQETWEQFYMGDDGRDGAFDSATMFVDMVERKFAKNSCAPLDERYDLLRTAEEMWNYLKKVEANKNTLEQTPDGFIRHEDKEGE